MDVRRPDHRVFAVALATGFVVLAVVVAVRGQAPGDELALEAITEAAGTRFDDVARIIGDLTDPLPLIVAASPVALGLLRGGRRRGALLLVGCLVIAVVVNPWLKDLVDRSRPEVRAIPEPVSPLAFPAGHAANTAAFAGGLLLAVPSRWVRPAAVVGGATIAVTAWSRLVTGAHFPSDLIAGWLWMGAVVAALWPQRTAA